MDGKRTNVCAGLQQEQVILNGGVNRITMACKDIVRTRRVSNIGWSYSSTYIPYCQ